MASFQKNLFYNIVRLCRIKRKKNKFLQTSFLQKVKHILRERRLHYRRKVNVVVTLGTWVLASELCHRRRSSLTHITCRNSRHEEPGKLKKAKKKKTSRRESFVRTRTNLFPVRLRLRPTMFSFLRAIFGRNATAISIRASEETAKQASSRIYRWHI